MKFVVTLCAMSLATTSLWAAPKAKPEVFTQKAALSKVRQTLLFPALVKSRVESNIRADGDLIVVKSHVALGQRVKKGDVLLELRQQDTTMNYHNRLLRAPVGGVVAALMVGTGEYVQKGQDLALLNEPEKLYLKLEMPLAHHAEVKPGLAAHGTFNATSAQTPFEAQVCGVGAVLDTALGTVPVELEFKKPTPALLPGTITNIELVLAEQDKMLIPDNAIYYSGEKTFLPVLENGKIKKVEVKTKQAAKGQVEILEGITSGQEIVTGSGEFLKDGDQVTVAKKL
jgi:multidrug efflux pump subunit AcrA (membrane-fusion protein)